MKLLLDANLSWRLTAALTASFGDCAHVDHIGIKTPAKDTEIWERETWIEKQLSRCCSLVNHLLKIWIKTIMACWKSCSAVILPRPLRGKTNPPALAEKREAAIPRFKNSKI
jgi:hypothetical protein